MESILCGQSRSLCVWQWCVVRCWLGSRQLRSVRICPPDPAFVSQPALCWAPTDVHIQTHWCTFRHRLVHIQIHWCTFHWCTFRHRLVHNHTTGAHIVVHWCWHTLTSHRASQNHTLRSTYHNPAQTYIHKNTQASRQLNAFAKAQKNWTSVTKALNTSRYDFL